MRANWKETSMGIKRSGPVHTGMLVGTLQTDAQEMKISIAGNLRKE
jgi:hypothetical protein